MCKTRAADHAHSPVDCSCANGRRNASRTHASSASGVLKSPLTQVGIWGGGLPYNSRHVKGFAFALVLAAAAAARAERLPIQTFTSADGLAHDRVKCIYRDSPGVMWFC